MMTELRVEIIAENESGVETVLSSKLGYASVISGQALVDQATKDVSAMLQLVVGTLGGDGN